MIRRVALGAAALTAVAAVGFWAVTAPQSVPAEDVKASAGDAQRGETLFHIGGCASCHAAPGAEGEARLVLAGGVRLASPFGVFVAPNISTHPESGIGAWTLAEFATAMLHGVSPTGEHYFPAFPYDSYARMPLADITDLWAYLQTLPESAAENLPHEVGFPFSIRRFVGVWKRLYVSAAPVADLGPEHARGQYLVEGPGHCGACHTPRDLIGGPRLDAWLAGGPNPEGRGRIPNLTPGGRKIRDWSAADIAEYLKNGFTPDYDTAGGAMVDVVENTGRLSDEDRMAIAQYLLALPPIVDP